MKLSELAYDAGIRMGLPERLSKEAFGLKQGFPIQLVAGKDGNRDVLTGVIRYDDPAKDAAVLDGLKTSADVAQSGLKVKEIKAQGGILTVPIYKGIFSKPAPEEVAARMEAVLRVLPACCPAPAVKCRFCNTSSVNDLMLLNGLIDRICSGCVQKLQEESRQAEAAYDALPMNLPLAIVCAAALALVGAALWGGLIVWTHKMYWMTAIAIGAMIGWGATKAAGKGGVPVQTVCVVFTLLSVLLGLLVYVGHDLHVAYAKEGKAVDWLLFAKASPMILIELGGDTIFSLAGGLFGAWTAGQAAGKPKIGVEVGS